MIAGAAPTTPAGVTHLQQTLQAVVQSVNWTYSLFWHLCPQQGVLVWGDGYYNGAIKTRKTVQPVEVSTEEASLQRSQQLRELYESLSTGEANLPGRRPCAALSPEDLTEPEWFYLMCISFSFPTGHGVPGKAFARQRYVWLTGANEVDSKVFPRAILAKSANIQTVVCIPLMDGILELGHTEKVEEDITLIQHAKRFFIDYNFDAHIKPALSEQSTSNPFADHHPLLLQHQAATTVQQMHMDVQASNQEVEGVVTTAHGRRHNDDAGEEDEEEEEEEADYDDDEEGDEIEGSSRSEMKAMRYGAGAANLTEETMAMMKNSSHPTGEASDLMQLEISEGVRMGSTSDCSNNLEMEQMPSSMCDGGVLQARNEQRLQDQYLYKNWHLLLEDVGNASFQQSLGSRVQDFSPEDAHYSGTVSSIVRQNLKRWVAPSASFNSNLFRYSDPKRSAFSRWSSTGSDQHLLAISSSMSSSSSSASSQRLLKSILLGVRDRHGKFSGAADDGSSPKARDPAGGKLMQQQKYSAAAAQEEISANHVLAERRRREKLNERFMILRTLVPFVTKMDKASILGDTIEYVKQLRRRIQDLESRNKHMEMERPINNAKHQSAPPLPQKNITGVSSSRLMDKRRRKPQQVDSSEQGSQSANVQASVTEDKALLELRCGNRDGLLLKLMHALHEIGLEVTSIEFDSSDGVFNAEVHCEVKEVQGKRAGIVDLKRAIHQIIPS